MVSIDTKREAAENRTAVWCGRTALEFREQPNKDMPKARRTVPGGGIDPP